MTHNPVNKLNREARSMVANVLLSQFCSQAPNEAIGRINEKAETYAKAREMMLKAAADLRETTYRVTEGLD